MLIPLVVGPMATNAYIFSEDEKTCYIIDPGGDEDKIISIVDKHKLSPKGIICTHGHLDHTAAVGPLMETWGTEDGAGDFLLAVHEKDSAYLGPRAEDTHRRSFASLGIIETGYFSMLFNPSPEPNFFLKEGRTVPGTDLIVYHTPGHTEGSVCLYSEKERILFSGDTLFRRGIGRTDLPGGSGADIFNSIKNVIFTLPESTKVFSGHGPETDIGSEKQGNPFV